MDTLAATSKETNTRLFVFVIGRSPVYLRVYDNSMSLSRVYGERRNRGLFKWYFDYSGKIRHLTLKTDMAQHDLFDLVHIRNQNQLDWKHVSLRPEGIPHVKKEDNYTVEKMPHAEVDGTYKKIPETIYFGQPYIERLSASERYGKMVNRGHIIAGTLDEALQKEEAIGGNIVETNQYPLAEMTEREKEILQRIAHIHFKTRWQPTEIRGIYQPFMPEIRNARARF